MASFSDSCAFSVHVETVATGDDGADRVPVILQGEEERQASEETAQRFQHLGHLRWRRLCRARSPQMEPGSITHMNLLRLLLQTEARVNAHEPS